MAITYSTVAAHDRFGHRVVYVIDITADGSAVLDLTHIGDIRAIGFSSEGSDGGGTLTWFASPDGVTYGALGVRTVADAGGTAVVSATAAGVWSLHEHDLSFPFLKFTLASSTGPTLRIVVSVLCGKKG